MFPVPRRRRQCRSIVLDDRRAFGVKNVHIILCVWCVWMIAWGVTIYRVWRVRISDPLMDAIEHVELCTSWMQYMCRGAPKTFAKLFSAQRCDEDDEKPLTIDTWMRFRSPLLYTLYSRLSAFLCFSFWRMKQWMHGTLFCNKQTYRPNALASCNRMTDDDRSSIDKMITPQAMVRRCTQQNENENSPKCYEWRGVSRSISLSFIFNSDSGAVLRVKILLFTTTDRMNEKRKCVCTCAQCACCGWPHIEICIIALPVITIFNVPKMHSFARMKTGRRFNSERWPQCEREWMNWIEIERKRVIWDEITCALIVTYMCMWYALCGLYAPRHTNGPNSISRQQRK